jgi:hypothetical protein
MTSRNEGTEPVVKALTLGMVIVGGVACAVKGRAAPERMSSCVNVKPDPWPYTKSLGGRQHQLLVCMSPKRTYPPPQRVDGHENDLVEYPLWSIIAFEQAKSQLFIFDFFKGGQARQEGFVGKKACCEDEYRDGYDYVGKGESNPLRRRCLHLADCTMVRPCTQSSIVGQSHPVTRRNRCWLTALSPFDFLGSSIRDVFSFCTCGESSISLSLTLTLTAIIIFCTSL